jgi:HlyD family secretion protein
MKKLLAGAVFVLLALSALAVWLWGPSTPAVQLVSVTRGDFRTEVTTNGKVEPSEFANVHTELGGLIVEAAITQGQNVRRGNVLARLDSRQAEADLANAEARIAEAMAESAVLRTGGARREQVEIEQAIARHKVDLEAAEKALASAERLAAKGAGTQEEVRLARERTAQIQAAIAALEARKPVLVSTAELARAEARLREAQNAALLAKKQIELSLIRSPLDGIAYEVNFRRGDFVNPGALLARVGQTENVKVVVYVDEPELGRVSKGQPVRITWDALDGRSWQGLVEKVPTQIVAMGTRQVGEVECRIANPAGELLPGTNVNAAIETAKQGGVLLVTKDALRTEAGEEGVYVVENGVLAFRRIKTGARNITSAVVLEGLREGEQIVVSNDAALKPGVKVSPQPR